MKYVHIINDLRKLIGERFDLVEERQLKPFVVGSADMDKILIVVFIIYPPKTEVSK
jgi:hypothetical protein